MVCPDPAFRISAMQAYHHPALQPPPPAVIITPHFVRAATTFEEDEPLPPIPYHQDRPHSGDVNMDHINKKKPTTKPKAKKAHKDHNARPASSLGPRSATPTALGESIKQHTSAAKPKKEKSGKSKGKGREDIENTYAGESPKKGSKLVIKNLRDDRWSGISSNGKGKVEEEDPTRMSITSPTAHFVEDGCRH